MRTKLKDRSSQDPKDLDVIKLSEWLPSPDPTQRPDNFRGVMKYGFGISIPVQAIPGRRAEIDESEHFSSPLPSGRRCVSAYARGLGGMRSPEKLLYRVKTAWSYHFPDDARWGIQGYRCCAEIIRIPAFCWWNHNGARYLIALMLGPLVNLSRLDITWDRAF